MRTMEREQLGKTWRLISGFVVASLGWYLLASAQSGPGISSDQTDSRVQGPASTLQSTVTVEAIGARLEAVQRDVELEVKLKESLVSLYQKAIADLKLAGDAIRQRKDFASRIAAVPNELVGARRRKTEVPLRSEVAEAYDFFSLDVLQREVQAGQTKLAAATEARIKLSEQIETREKRRKDLPQLITDARGKSAQIDREIASITPDSLENPVLREATQWALTAAKSALLEQVQTMELEQRVHEAETELLPLQLELTKSEEKQLQEQVRLLSDELNQMKQDRIIQQRQEVQQLVNSIPESLKELGEGLLARTQQWLDLAKKRSAAKSDLDVARLLLEKWKDRFGKMVTRVEPQNGQEAVAGFNSWVGMILRKQRSELPSLLALNGEVRHYQLEMQSADSLLFELEDSLMQIGMWTEGERTVPADSNSKLSSLLAADTSDRPYLLRLVGKEKELIEVMRVDVDGYLSDLYQVADIKEQTGTLVTQYHAFIEKHVLWIRSADQLKRTDYKPAVEAFRWLVEFKNWRWLGVAIATDARRQPWWYLLFGAVFCICLFNQTRARRSLGNLGIVAAKGGTTSFLPTVKSLILSVLIAAPITLWLLFAAWRLSVVEQVDVSFARSLAQGLLLAVWVFVPLELLRQTCRPNGLGVWHFDWPEETCRLVAGNLRWAIDLGVPMVGVVGIFDGLANARWEASLGRLAFLVLMVLASVLLMRVFVPQQGVFAFYLRERPGGWLDRLRYFWYPTIVAGPLILAGISFSGFHYTAQRLALHLNTSIWMLAGLLLLYSLLRRWLLVNRRKIMIAQAKQRLADAAKRDQSQAATTTGMDDSEVNVVIINEQTRRLLTSFVIVSGLIAVAMIWSDVLPAISMLDRFKLWDVQGDTPDQRVSITLSNIVLVVPIVVLTVIAGRNLPGLMEIALLQHLPLTGAARYAITTISCYAILAIGTVIVSSTIGLRWSSIQWLVAALGVGLGFGLQEIFANFVSGIILLFEQPMRVGDIITLDGVTGSVQRIRMRATTIINWDRQELIIPNKDLITGKLLNWTLSDTTNRIVIRIGVAYGSDTELACCILQQICHNHPNVLDEPPTTVVFDQFGDNSLNLTVRTFLASLDVRLQTIHELHTQIYQQFSSAGIEIAFPQRDLHLRSVAPSIIEMFGRK